MRLVKPQLAKSADRLPAGEQWLYEIKWDGVRCVATVGQHGVHLQSRSAKTNFAERYPQVAVAVASLPDGIYDGELVQFTEDGDTFGIRRGGTGDYRLVLFDVLESEGHDQRLRTLDARRALLAAILEQKSVDRRWIEMSPGFEDGEQLLAWVQGRGLEGIVAKRRSSLYREGARTGEWLKIKVRNEQEFVVCGWTDGEGKRAGKIGSLVLGLHGELGLFYVGRVGSGINDDDELVAGMTPTAECPFGAVPWPECRYAHWCVPELVVQVAFQRFTDDGRVWHPSYRGLRHDKDASEVGRD